MKTILNVCLIFALSPVLVGYGFSQAVASKEVTPPVSDQEIPEQYMYSRDSSVPKDGYEYVESQPQSFHGLVLPAAIERKLNANDFDDAWADFENLKQGIDKSQEAQLLEAEIYLCERSSFLDVANKETWLAKLKELRATILSKFPKFPGAYTSQFDPSFPPEQIINYSTMALKYNPKDSFALEQRGRTYIHIGKISEGCADLEKLSYRNDIIEYTTTCRK